MQEPLNFSTPTSTTIRTNPNPLLSNFPSKSPNYPPPKFLTLSSSKSPTAITTTKNKDKDKIPIIPSTTTPPTLNETPKKTPSPPSPKPVISSNPLILPDFKTKALYLDSLGLESLNLPPTAVATASLVDTKHTIEYLTSFSLSHQDIQRIISMCPEILRLKHKTDIAPVFAFLLREAKVPFSSLRRVLRSRPRLLVSDVATRLRPTLYFLKSIGIDDVTRNTNLLSCSVEEKFVPRIQYFEKIGFSYREAVSMFKRFPQLFCYSVKENYEPKFNYFVVEMGRELKELKEYPQYFSFSLEKRIKPRHQSCVEHGVCFPLDIMFILRDEQFRERLLGCCDSSMPRSSSPLWNADANDFDVDTTL